MIINKWNQLIGERLRYDKSDKWYKLICIVILCIIMFVVFVCAKSFSGARVEYIIAACISLVTVLVLSLFCFTKIDFWKYVFVYIILMGGMLVFIQPILNVPDESAHFARSELLSRGEFFIDPDLQVFETIESVQDIQKEVGKTYVQSNVKDETIDYSSAEVLHVAASNISVIYIPQAIGIMVAKLLNLDAIWLLWMARIFNLVFYSLLVFLAIKIAPKLKMLIFFAAALPISIQQAASCSPDAMINGIAFLLFAYFIHLYYSKEGTIKTRDEICFFILGSLTTLAKISNIFITGLILLVPGSSFKNKKRAYFVKSIILLGVVILGGAYYLYTTTFAPNLEHLEYLKQTGVDSTKQLEFIIGNFKMWLQIFGAALIYQANDYLKMFNYFGPIQYGYEILTPILIFMFAKICYQEDGIKLRIYEKICIFSMSIGIYIATCFAMYLSWTGVGAVNIEGVQGRYFIPLLVLCAFLFTSERKEVNNKRIHIVDITAINVMLSSMLITLTAFYY